MLFHAAAVVGRGVLAGGSVSPASFLAAGLKQGIALRQQVADTLLVSSHDATAAAAAHPALLRLALLSFLAAAHDRGIDLAEAGVQTRLSDEEKAASRGVGGLGIDSDSSAGNGGGGSTSAAEMAEAEAVAEAAAAAEAQEDAEAPAGFLASLLQLCPDAAAAAELGAAAEQLLASGLAAPVSLRNAVCHFRVKLQKAGVQLGSNIHITCNNMTLKTLGGGDASAGARVKAAIDAWQAGLQSLGAGPMRGLSVQPEKLQEWRKQVDVGWPGSEAFFTAALDAGAELSQLANRWPAVTVSAAPSGLGAAPALRCS